MNLTVDLMDNAHTLDALCALVPGASYAITRNSDTVRVVLLLPPKADGERIAGVGPTTITAIHALVQKCRQYGTIPADALPEVSA